MDFHFIWKAIVVVIGGVLILRLAGRKSISQLTVAQTVMMIAVGSLIIQPVGDRNIWITMVITFLMVLTLISIEYVVLRSNALETFIYGKSLLVVENGQINEGNLKKLRLTVDMLEVRMRQQNIPHFSDLKWATIESNGQLGYMLKSDKQYATKEDIQMLKSLIESNQSNSRNEISKTQPSASDNIFTEVKNRKHKEKPKESLD
ncbi:YetF domain-containing protein [Cytobacillus firmus]|uniref:YetF domain-containing protein n=1 Tax=Cytobacillus firmus TaxID=1399 RepID=UPI0018CE23D8|nr:membrane protein [Cytobacillus firmus]